MAKPVALVTGGAIRVGRAISEALGDAGYRLLVNYNTSASAAESLVEALAGRGVEAKAVRADLTDPRQVEKLVSAAIDAYGRIDLLVNNAAVFDERPFLEVDEDLWRDTLAVNLDAPFRIAQAVARVMTGAGGGRIVNICGTAGISPIGAYAPYCAAKAGLDMLTRCMAEALAPGVQVNGVAPGTVLFPEDTDEEERRRVTSMIPGGRIGRPEDVAAAVCFLAAAPDFITGAILTVDGGASLTSG